MEQYYAREDFSYSGDSTFTIPFSFIKREHIEVYVNDETTTNFVFLNDSQITINDTMQAGDIVSIRRNTPINSKMVNFTDLNILNGETQNLAQTQLFNAIQEIYDDNIKYKNELTEDTADYKENLTADFEDFKDSVNDDIDDFKDDVTDMISSVSEAASKINQLEEAVDTAVSKAGEASESAEAAANSATTASNLVGSVGDVTTLTTTAKDTIVAAVNEVNSAVGTLDETCEKIANKGQPNGYAPLDNTSKVPLENLPSTYTKFSINNGKMSNGVEDVLNISTADTLYFNVDNENPITYTNAMGETYTKNYLAPIDVSDKADGTYNVMLDSTNQPYLHSGNIYYQKTEPTNTTVVGIPTINNGVVSGFSGSNFLSIDNASVTNSFEYKYKFTTSSDVSTLQFLKGSSIDYKGLAFGIQNGKFVCNVSTSGSSPWSITGNNKAGTYNVQTNTTYYVKVSYNGSVYKLSYSLTDEENSYVDDITTSSTTQLGTIYNVIGVTNSVGIYAYPFLGSIDLKESYIKVDNQLWWRYGLLSNDIWLNKNIQKAYINQNNELIEFTDVPCGKIAITSGVITSIEQPRFNELRYKYSSMPSDNYIDLTLLSSGSTYTAPADGWVGVWMAGTTNLSLDALGSGVGAGCTLPSKQAMGWYILIRKGQKFQVQYATGYTDHTFRFYYAEGEV